MRWTIRLIEVVRQFPQHGRIAIYRANWLAMFIGERGQPVIGPENIGGAIDEIKMLLV